MGYAATTNVMYGIEITESQALEFMKALKATLFSKGSLTLDIFDYYKTMEACQEYLALNDYFTLRGYDAHSAIQDCEWFNTEDPIRSYTLGFTLGGNGYGCDDDLVAIIQTPVSSQIKKQWDTVIAPSLKSCGITDKPKLRTTQQIH